MSAEWMAVARSLGFDPKDVEGQGREILKRVVESHPHVDGNIALAGLKELEKDGILDNYHDLHEKLVYGRITLGHILIANRRLQEKNEKLTMTLASVTRLISETI